MNIDPALVLEGSLVRLTPYANEHREELCSVLDNPAIWTYTWRNNPGKTEHQRDFDHALRQKAEQTRLPFAIFDRKSGAIIGTTSLGDLDRHNRNAEIGWTALSPDFWRTGVNTECKYLLLRYGFEEWSALRVQFSVSGFNLRSQQAVERLGAVKEGVFRRHRVEPDGPVHDNVFYSILDTEWPDVRQRLLDKMAKTYV